MFESNASLWDGERERERGAKCETSRVAAAGRFTPNPRRGITAQLIRSFGRCLSYSPFVEAGEISERASDRAPRRLHKLQLRQYIMFGRFADN